MGEAAESRLTQLHEGTPDLAWLGDAAISRYSQKKNMPFCAFFHVQPKCQNDDIFVNFEGLRPCLSKPSYRAPKWALMVRLMQQERRKSPQKSIFQKTGPFGDVTETAILAILASHFRDRMDLPKESST